MAGSFTDDDYLPTEQLRSIASATDGGRSNWKDWSREMLIAFFRNRPEMAQPVKPDPNYVPPDPGVYLPRG